MATESDQQTTSKGQWTNKPPAKVNAHPFFLKSKVLLLNSPFPWINSPCLAALSSPFHGRGKLPRNAAETSPGPGPVVATVTAVKKAATPSEQVEIGMACEWGFSRKICDENRWLVVVTGCHLDYFPRKIGNVKSSRY